MIFESIIGAIAGPFVDRFFGSVTDIAKQYINKQITEVDAKKAIALALTDAAKSIEVSHSETLAKTYASFWQAADTDKTNIMKIMWAAAVGSQIFVLFWSQFCVPLMFAYSWLPNWKAGTTAEWSYLLIGALLGLGPMVLRSGPASGGGIVDGLKKLAGK